VVYPYECSCGYTTEVVKGCRDAARTEYCPSCNAAIMERRWTVPLFNVRSPDPIWVQKAKSDGQSIANVDDYKSIKPKVKDYQPTDTEMREIAQVCGT